MSTLPLLLLAAFGGCAHRVQDLEAELADRDATIEVLRSENVGYQVELTDLRGEIADLRARDAELARLYQGLITEFTPELADGTAAIVVYPDHSELVFGDTITFETGSAELDIEGRAATAELARLLLAHPDRRFQVAGHTDPTPIVAGPYASNWSLGAARAVRVVEELVTLGVPASQLSAASYADTEPFATNAHPAGMAVNRRVSVALQTTVEETGAQKALWEAAREHGRAWMATTGTTTPVAVR